MYALTKMRPFYAGGLYHHCYRSAISIFEMDGLCKNVLDFSVVVGKFMLNWLRWQSSEEYRFLDI